MHQLQSSSEQLLTAENDSALSVYSLTSVDHFVDIKISYLQPACFIQPDNSLQAQRDFHYVSVGVFLWPLWNKWLFYLGSGNVFTFNLYLMFPLNVANYEQKQTASKSGFEKRGGPWW